MNSRTPLRWVSSQVRGKQGGSLKNFAAQAIITRNGISRSGGLAAFAVQTIRRWVKIGEVTPPKRPSILGPLELGEPIDHSGTPPPPRSSMGRFSTPPSNSDPPLLPPLRGNRGRICHFE